MTAIVDWSDRIVSSDLGCDGEIKIRAEITD